MPKLWLAQHECNRAEKLPEICIVCGADADDYMRKKFSWVPGWTNFLLLFGVLPAAILQAIVRQSLTVHVPVCREHRSHWSKRELFIWIAALVIIALGIIGVVVYSMQFNNGKPPPPESISIGLVVIVALCSPLVVISQLGVSVVRIDRDEVQFKNVDPDFADAVREQRKARRKRDRYDDEDEPRSRHRRRREEDDDDEDDYADDVPRSRRRRDRHDW
jgi:hypothetical protein